MTPPVIEISIPYCADRRPNHAPIHNGGIDDVVADLAAKGVTIVTPVSEAPGGWSADFLDPDGFGLGLWQSGEFPRSLK